MPKPPPPAPSSTSMLTVTGILVAGISLLLYPRITHLASLHGLQAWEGQKGIQGSPLALTGCSHLTAPNLEGCASGGLIPGSSNVLLACGNLERRESWWPPAGRYDIPLDTSSKPHQDSVFWYDPSTEAIAQVALEGYSEELINHAISVYPMKSGLLRVAIVNHHRSGSRVELFDLNLSAPTLTLQWRSTVRQAVILRTPHAIQLVSPTEFFLTNDHLLTPRPLWHLESNLAFSTGNVIFCSSEDGKAGEKSTQKPPPDEGDIEERGKCRVVAGDLRYPTGLSVSLPGGDATDVGNWKVYVAEGHGMQLIEYETSPGGIQVTGGSMLREVHSLPLPAPPLSLHADPVSGALYITTTLPGQTIHSLLRSALPKKGTGAQAHPEGMTKGTTSTTTDPLPSVHMYRVQNETGEQAYFGIKYRVDHMYAHNHAQGTPVTQVIVDQPKGASLMTGLGMVGMWRCPLSQ